VVRPRSFAWYEFDRSTLITVYLVVLTLYLAVAWAATGRTFGDQVMGLRVIHARGGRLHPIVALGRSAFYVIFPLGFFWAGIDIHRRSVQDLVLRSSVVHDWTRHVPPRAGQA
jgi:uncharacterized RDD family membrane protein YckC